MDLAGFCDKNIIVSDEALHCGGGRGVKPFFVKGKALFAIVEFFVDSKNGAFGRFQYNIRNRGIFFFCYLELFNFSCFGVLEFIFKLIYTFFDAVQKY